ncbi:MAG: glycosyltransferase family 2 protein [Phycisphaerae bacterium]
MLTLGIIVPIYNEDQILDQLYERMSQVMCSLDMPAVVCLVDDGSVDQSLAKIKGFCAKDQRFRYLSFSRNFGHQTAVLAGLRELDADVYVVMDGDLQDPPELIPELLMKWRSGYEVVYCVRQTRQENVVRRWAYAAFYRLLRAVAYLRIPLDTGDFCLMDRIVVQHMRRMPEHNHFIRGLRTWIGFRQTAYYYHRDARSGGASKYTLSKLFALAYDGLISFSFAPLRAATKLGFLVSFVAFVAICGLVVQKLVFGIPLLGWTSTVVTILFMGGVQLLTLGIMGEYVGRIFDEVKGRPLYIIREQQLSARNAEGHSAVEEEVRDQSRSRFIVDQPVEAVASGGSVAERPVA